MAILAEQAAVSRGAASATSTAEPAAAAVRVAETAVSTASAVSAFTAGAPIAPVTEERSFTAGTAVAAGRACHAACTGHRTRDAVAARAAIAPVAAVTEQASARTSFTTRGSIVCGVTGTAVASVASPRPEPGVATSASDTSVGPNCCCAAIAARAAMTKEVPAGTAGTTSAPNTAVATSTTVTEPGEKTATATCATSTAGPTIAANTTVAEPGEPTGTSPDTTVGAGATFAAAAASSPEQSATAAVATGNTCVGAIPPGAAVSEQPAAVLTVGVGSGAVSAVADQPAIRLTEDSDGIRWQGEITVMAVPTVENLADRLEDVLLQPPQKWVCPLDRGEREGDRSQPDVIQ